MFFFFTDMNILIQAVMIKKLNLKMYTLITSLLQSIVSSYLDLNPKKINKRLKYFAIGPGAR